MFKGKKWLVAPMIMSALFLGACSNDEASSKKDDSTKIVEVAYRDAGQNTVQKWFKEVKVEFEKQHEGVKVKFVPVKASEGDFFAKAALMMKSSSTSPDVISEDTFILGADAKAGYLEPLTEKIEGWEDWGQFYDGVGNGVKVDGDYYGVPYSTDTRGLWYNTEAFEKAGITLPWEPKSWDDIIETAKILKEKNADIIPFWANVGKATGEATSMQTFEMLLYGTGNTLYESKAGKWDVSNKGIQDSLAFLDEIYQNKLGVDLSKILNGQADATLQQDLMPNKKVAIVLNGNWVASALQENMKDYSDVWKLAAMPTKDGQEPGFVTMSGGHALSVPTKSDNKDLAWEFVKLATNKKYMMLSNISQGFLTPREDVAQDSQYTEALGESYQVSASFLDYANFRPSSDKYPSVSGKIQEAVESVVTGTVTPKEAAEKYNQNVTTIVGKDNTK